MTYIPPVNGGRINATISGNTAGAAALVSSGTMTLAGGNNITLSQAGNAITISGGAGGGAASNTLGMSNLGNTSGTTGVISGSQLQFAFAGGNNVTLSQSLNGSSGTITISAANQSIQTQGLQSVNLTGNTAGAMTTISSGAMTLAGGNNITLSQAGNAITISGGAGGGGGGIAAVPDALASTFSSGTVNFVDAGGALTVSASTAGAGQTINFSVPQTSSISATGALSISTNGSTISMGVPMFNAGVSTDGNTAGNTGTNTNGLVLVGGNNITLSQGTNSNGATVTISGGAGGGGAGVTLSTWEPWPIQNPGIAPLSANTATSGSATFIPFVAPVNVAAGFINVLQSMSIITGGTSSYSQSATLNYGLYSRGTGANSTTISQLTSGSYSYAMSYNNSSLTVSQPTSSATSGYAYGTTSGNTILTANYNGLKLVQLPLNSTITPGVYWLGLLDRASTAGFNSGLRYSYMGNSLTLTGLAPMGSAAAGYVSGAGGYGGQGGNWQLGQGVYSSVGLTNLPSTVGMASITQSGASASVIPYMKFVTT